MPSPTDTAVLVMPLVWAAAAGYLLGSLSRLMTMSAVWPGSWRLSDMLAMLTLSLPRSVPT